MFQILLVGAGDRGMIYAKQSLLPDSPFRIVGVVEPDPIRRQTAASLFHLPSERCFATVEEAAAKERFADAVFNCTMDHQHAATSVPFLKKGYDMLLEKPIAPNRKDALRILRCARENGCRVMVCHVLRYAPFYREMKRLILDGAIGTILNIQMAEQVSYYHMSVSYVRGKYGLKETCGSGMLLSKCSHDLDLMAWFMNNEKPSVVYSAGSLMQYNNAPEQTPERCSECPLQCIYHAERLYVDSPQRWANRVWNDCALSDASDEEKRRSLRNAANPYGRCVYHTDMEVVDHQSVLVAFESGATATLNMTGGASAAGRSIRVTGTLGEIEGHFEDETFRLHRICPEAPGGRLTQPVNVSAQQNGDAHGGGDQLLLQDFWKLLEGKSTSICCTSLEESIVGHEIAYRAEECRLRNSSPDKK